MKKKHKRRKLVKIIRHFGGGQEIGKSWGAFVGLASPILMSVGIEEDPVAAIIRTIIFVLVNLVAAVLVDYITTRMYNRGEIPWWCIIPCFGHDDDEEDE